MEMTRAEVLEAYIMEHAGRPVRWGVSDCCMFVASWVERASGVKLPTPHYMGEEHGRALIDAAGGLEPIWRDIATRGGLWTTGAPDVGDVALIDTTRWGPIGAIWGGSGYAYWRTLNGVTMVAPHPDTVVASWSVPE